MKNLLFEVVGDNKLHCGGCESAVKFVLSDLAGVQAVQTSYKNQCIAVQCDERQNLSPAQIMEELDRLGYRVEEVRP